MIVTAISSDSTKAPALYQQIASLKDRKTKLESMREYIEKYREYLEVKKWNIFPLTKYLWTIDKRIQKEEAEIMFRMQALLNVYQAKSALSEILITHVSLEPSRADSQSTRKFTTKEKLTSAL
jgi:hypothetical protein